MRELLIKLYRFEELDKKTQEKVLDDNRYTLTTGNWYASTLSFWEDNLTKMGFMSPDIEFSGFYSQGDGAPFTAMCDAVQIMDTMVRCYGHDYGWDYKQVRLWLELSEKDLITFDVHKQNHYPYKNSVNYSVEHLFTDVSDIFVKKCAIKDLSDYFSAWCNELCGAIYEDLQNEYEYLVSDDAIVEFFDANEFEFLADGTISKF